LPLALSLDPLPGREVIRKRLTLLAIGSIDNFHGGYPACLLF
jgi:hypothetical protein